MTTGAKNGAKVVLEEKTIRAMAESSRRG